jgi:hypothetical protein
MKRKCPLTAVIVVVLFLNPVCGFTQQSVTLSEISDDMSRLTTDMGGAASFMASIGLNWPDAYIGQLVDFPAHWGAGLTVGATTLKLDNLEPLLSKFGYQIDDSFNSKQLLPVYVAEARLGGIKMAPFDVGIKFGMFPYIPLFADSVNYEASVLGLDFRLQLAEDRYNFPAISIGLEVDRTMGGLRRETGFTIQAAAGDIEINGGTAGVVWDVWVFDLKLMVSKKFWQPRLTIFGGLRLGASITKTGYEFTDGASISIGGIMLENMSDSDMASCQSALQSEAGNGMTFEVTKDNITGWIDAIGYNFSVYEGISIRFTSMTNMTVSLMTDIIHFEMGANISFRYQQQ